MPLDQVNYIKEQIQGNPGLITQAFRHPQDFKNLYLDLLSASTANAQGFQNLVNGNVGWLREKLMMLPRTVDLDPENADLTPEDYAHELTQPAQFLGTVDALKKLEAFAEEIVDPVKESKDFQELLLAYYPDPDTRLWVEKQILSGLLAAIVSALPAEDKALGEALVIAYETQGLPQNERQELIRDKLPPAQVSPEVCYFNGKNNLSFWGHVSVRLPTDKVPHSVVVCDSPLPDAKGNPAAMKKYLEDLPIDPHHNAFLLAHGGYSYNMMLIPIPEEEKEEEQKEAEDPEAQEENRQKHFKSHFALYTKSLMKDALFQTSPYLVRQGEDLSISHISPSRNKRELTKLPRCEICFMSPTDRYQFSDEKRLFIYQDDKGFFYSRPEFEPGVVQYIDIDPKFRDKIKLNQPDDAKFIACEDHSLCIAILKQTSAEDRRHTKPASLDREILMSLHQTHLKEDEAKGSFASAALQEGDPALLDPDVLKTMTKYTRISKKIWYLSRKQPSEKPDAEDPYDNDLFKLSCIDSDKFDRFKGSYVESDFLPAGEHSRCVANLSREQIDEAQDLFPVQVPDQYTYLTFGTAPGSFFRRRPKTVLEAGVSGDHEFYEEGRTYLKRELTESEKKHERRDMDLDEDFYAFELPARDWDQFEKARTDFANRDRNGYDLLKNNCAHAVQDLLKSMGLYDENYTTRLPSWCASQTCEQIKNHIEEEREKIFQDSLLPSAEKARRLISLEIYRLEIQLDQDRIDHTARETALGRKSIMPFKDTGIKTEKIEYLTRLFDQMKTRTVNEAQKGAFEELIAFFLSKDSKSKTAAHLQECLDHCFQSLAPEAAVAVPVTPAQPITAVKPPEVKHVISIHSHPSFLQQLREPALKETAYPSPDTWVEIQGSQGQYRYVPDEKEARKVLRAAITQPPEASALGAPLEKAPPLRDSRVRLSTQVSNDLRFGLLEKCVKPGQELRSELIPPRDSHLTDLQWLLMVDRQYEEGCKALGKTGKVITIHTLDFSHLQRQLGQAPAGTFPPLKPFEIAYIQYCVVMNLTCRVMNGSGKETLDADFIRKILPPFNIEASREKIMEERQLAQPAPTPSHSPAP